MDYLDFITRRHIIFTLLNCSVMLLIFVADLQFTTEMYIGVLYLVVIMLSLWLPSNRYTIFFAIISTVLTCTGYFLSIYKINIQNYINVTSFINLGMTISAIWVTTIIAIYIKSISTALKKSETIYKAILAASIDPIVIINQRGIIESASEAIEKTFGWVQDEIIGKRFDKLLARDFKDKYNLIFDSNLNKGSSNLVGTTHEIQGHHRMKRDFPCELSINYIYIPDLDKTLYTAVLRDISVRKATEQKMGWLSTHDELTKIYNRRYFNEQIDREWLRLQRAQDPLSVIIIDVDYFKNYNDYLGHQTGDTCLKMIASSLQECCRRSTDFVARFGGEEFIVVLPSTDINGARKIANVIQEGVHNLSIPHPSSKCSKKVSVSLGIATMVPSAACSYERLIRFADQALYKAKEAGRDRLWIHED